MSKHFRQNFDSLFACIVTNEKGNAGNIEVDDMKELNFGDFMPGPRAYAMLPPTARVTETVTNYLEEYNGEVQ